MMMMMVLYAQLLTLAVASLMKHGLASPRRSIIRQSRVHFGSTVSLIGLIDEPVKKPPLMLWFNEDKEIPLINTEKYSFLDNAATLVIHNFQTFDIGSYFFVYMNNQTMQDIVFRLDIISSSYPRWYEGGSRTVGTIIGMGFLCVMVLALVYYCCSKDADTGFPKVKLKQFQSPIEVQNSHCGRNYNNNNMTIRYSGMKFTSGVHVAPNTGRRKSSREVRQESMHILGKVSRDQSMAISKKKKCKRKKDSFAIIDTPSSPTLL